MHGLPDLPELEINRCCLEALGWEHLGGTLYRDPTGCEWTPDPVKELGKPAWFTRDLNLVHQYLVPHIEKHGVLPYITQFEYHAFIERWATNNQSRDEYGFSNRYFIFVNAPARVRALAFISVMDRERKA